MPTTDLNEIIRDLNVTIADTETALGEFHASKEKTTYNGLLKVEGEFKRAIGQLKAARASLITARQAATNVTSEKVS